MYNFDVLAIWCFPFSISPWQILQLYYEIACDIPMPNLIGIFSGYHLGIIITTAIKPEWRNTPLCVTSWVTKKLGIFWHFFGIIWRIPWKNAAQKSEKVMVTNDFAFFWISLHSRQRALKKTCFAKTFFVFRFLDIFKNVHFRKVTRLYVEHFLLFQVFKKKNVFLLVYSIFRNEINNSNKKVNLLLCKISMFWPFAVFPFSSFQKGM